ncbi:protein RESPONSE TO ABA AND SALT 1 [Solanum stenotomum]|uniref:protein RESPONSE TO ABA AND SALT 1 n=1 Tax=Solanum stenotomum TaxID=172797 RepID=UPI0020D08319|nr:protein RESPONSE TO ABA AND SALT 1 [Solanum stenotomum]
MASTSTSQTPSNINPYYENWLIQLQNFLEKLNAISSSYGEDEEENKSSELVTQVLDHYQDYYREKFNSTNRDVFLLVSPPWYTSLEKTFLWIAGFKPSTLFPTINYSIGSELTTEQGEKLKRLKAETKREEKVIEKGMAKVQERVAAPPIFELMKRGGTVVDGEAKDLESIIDGLKNSMMSMVETAEHLRGSTVRKILDILRQKQSVKLLAAVAKFHLQARKLGLQMDIQSTKKDK